MTRKLSTYVSILLILLLLFMAASLFIGVYTFEYGFVETLRLYFVDPASLNAADRYVLEDIRIPRVLMAALIGAGLAVSGTSLQGLFKNPLASPDLIGITSGSVLFAALTIVLGHFIRPYIPEFLQYSLLSLMSFIGALLTMSFVYRMASSHGKTNIAVLLLSGVAITALTGAATGLMTYLSTDEELRNLTFWTLGSLSGANWTQVLILAVVLLVSLWALLGKGKALNALLLGEHDASHLGIEIEPLKRRIVVFTALMVGTSVAFAGTIGFVGLIVPYILRLLFQSNYALILPLSALCGSLLLLLADTLSRSIVAPSELPIGIVTAIMGAPVFIALLIRFKKSL